jgi:hypothetical protein
MPKWIPARVFIDYLMDAFLIAPGICVLVARKTRMAVTYLGPWIVLRVVVIYGPVLIGALADPSTAVKVEGLMLIEDALSRKLLLKCKCRKGIELIAPHRRRRGKSVRRWIEYFEYGLLQSSE